MGPTFDFTYTTVSRHDKDFRVLACLPPEALCGAVLVVLRVNYAGSPIVETVTGEDASESASPPHLWVLIHRGHMRMLAPPPGLQDPAWLSSAARPCTGWARAGGAASACSLEKQQHNPPTPRKCVVASQRVADAVVRDTAGEVCPPRAHRQSHCTQIESWEHRKTIHPTARGVRTPAGRAQ